MSRSRSLAVLFAIAVGGSMPASAEEKLVEIPLKEVWAFQMPGTRDVRELPPVRADARLLESIRKALEPDLNHKQARHGFVVSGIGEDALRRAHDVLVGKDKPKARFSAGEELTAVFFSYQSPFYVHLEKVERKGFAMRISYRFVPHESGETTEHFALIPLGKLAPGRYGVRVEQSPMEKKYTDVGFMPPPKSAGEQIVSRTYNFVIAE